MITGLLLYTQTDTPRNKWFIDHLVAVCATRGIDLRFAVYDPKHLADETFVRSFDFCVNRTRFVAVNRAFEACGKRCFNNAETVEIGNDKWLTYVLCKDLGIPVMDTCRLNSAAVSIAAPFVVKSRNGHGGNEVFWAQDTTTLASLPLSNASGYIAQAPASDTGVDVRVYVLGGEPIAAVKRTSAADFRSNYSLGGQVELFTPTSDQLRVIDALQGALQADYVGYDFILHNGAWVLNEIEDAVGARMLYSLCDYDVGEAFVHNIAKTMR